MGAYQDCKYAILDTVWGEYKCKKKHHRIYNPDECANCGEYKSKIPEPVKRPTTDA